MFPCRQSDSNDVSIGNAGEQRTPPWLIMNGVMDEKDPLQPPRFWSRMSDRLRGSSWEYAICSKHPSSYCCTENYLAFTEKHFLPSMQEVLDSGMSVCPPSDVNVHAASIMQT